MAQTTVKAEQIAINAISGTIIADNAITSVHIAQNAILTQHIDDGQVDTAQLADDAVTNAKIADSSVVTAHIQDDQVTGDKLANNITIAGTLTSTGAFTSPGIDDNADAIAITIDSSENVGIGTSSPSSTAGWGTLLEVSGTTNAGIKLTETDTADGDYSLGTTAGTFRIWDEAASAFRLTLDGSGKVGIGETSPQGQLHVKSADSGATADAGADELVVEGSSNAGISILSGASASGSIYFGDSGSAYDGYIQYDQTNRKFNIVTATSGGITIDSGGHLIMPNSYSSVRRIYSSYQSEVFYTTSAGSAETKTLDYYFPYMEHTSVFLRVYLTGAGNHSYMYKLSVLNGYYSCTVQVVASYMNAGGTAYADSISISHTGNYNTRRLTVAFDAASNVAPSDFTAVAYYGVAGGM